MTQPNIQKVIINLHFKCYLEFDTSDPMPIEEVLQKVSQFADEMDYQITSNSSAKVDYDITSHTSAKIVDTELYSTEVLESDFITNTETKQ